MTLNFSILSLLIAWMAYLGIMVDSSLVQYCRVVWIKCLSHLEPVPQVTALAYSGRHTRLFQTVCVLCSSRCLIFRSNPEVRLMSQHTLLCPLHALPHAQQSLLIDSRLNQL